MKASKNKLDFEREFKPLNIPFGDIVNNNADFRNELFLQYCNAEAVPSLHLYLADFYSEDEINKGYEEASNQKPISTSTSKDVVATSLICKTPFEHRIRELISEFDEKVYKDKKASKNKKVSKKELPLKYYCNDIEKTTIVQTLRAIDGQLDLLKKSVFGEKPKKYKGAKISAQTVIQLALKLGKFASIILDDVKQDDNNIFLSIIKADISRFEFWKTIKRNFNYSISKALPPQQTETKSKQEQPKTLSGLITHKNSVEIVEGIKVQYKNIKGKKLKLLLLALQELDLFPNERLNKKFHDCCKNEFDWGINTYTAMNDYTYNKHTDKLELSKMKIYLETLTKNK